jgi:hypothetical protein
MGATGPTAEDHIREAERLLDAANRRLAGNDAEWLNTPQRRAELRTEAQVRATLAQTLKAGELMPMMAGIAEWLAAGCPVTTPPAVASEAVPDDGPCCTGCGPGCARGGSPHEASVVAP